jgi:hypothetical protein
MSIISNKHPELFTNTGEFEISLAEIGIVTPETRIQNDGELFEEIRTKYKQVRGYWRSHILCLFNPIEVY